MVLLGALPNSYFLFFLWILRLAPVLLLLWRLLLVMPRSHQTSQLKEIEKTRQQIAKQFYQNQIKYFSLRSVSRRNFVSCSIHTHDSTLSTTLTCSQGKTQLTKESVRDNKTTRLTNLTFAIFFTKHPELVPSTIGLISTLKIELLQFHGNRVVEY